MLYHSVQKEDALAVRYNHQLRYMIIFLLRDKILRKLFQLMSLQEMHLSHLQLCLILISLISHLNQLLVLPIITILISSSNNRNNRFNSNNNSSSNSKHNSQLPMYLLLPTIKEKDKVVLIWMNLIKRESTKCVPKMSNTIRKSTKKMISLTSSMTLKQKG